MELENKFKDMNINKKTLPNEIILNILKNVDHLYDTLEYNKGLIITEIYKYLTIKKNRIKNKHYLNEIMTTYKILIEIYLEKDDEEKRENTFINELYGKYEIYRIIICWNRCDNCNDEYNINNIYFYKWLNCENVFCKKCCKECIECDTYENVSIVKMKNA